MAKKESSLASILNQYNAEKEETFIPTGVLPIDEILGGGLTPGGMYCAWGPPGSFKSTVSMQIAKSYCKRGDKVVIIDVEKALNQQQQETFGVREYVLNGTLIHVTVETYAQADELCLAIASEKDSGIKLVIVDSETQLMPKMGEDVQVDSNQPGVKAKQSSVWITKMKAAFYNAGITSIILAHARANLNMTSPYGPSTKMAGNYATLHVPDAIIQFLPGQKFGDKLAPEGVVCHISTDKNKFAPPFKRVDAKCYYGVGVKKSVYLVDWALENGVIEKNGSFFNVNGQSIRGTEALYNMSSENLKWILNEYNERLKK